MLPNDVFFCVARQPHASRHPDYHWLGNVRELEQCIRRICLTGTYQAPKPQTGNEQIGFRNEAGDYYSAQQLLQNYCRFLYDRLESFEVVARIVGLDSRTINKHLRSDK